MSRRSQIGRAALFAALMVVIAGCTEPTASDDKSGTDTVVLHIGTIDSINANGMYYGSEAFVEGLEEVSGGRIKVEVVDEFGDGAADAESRLVEAIATGELDGGIPATRAFAEAGISGLEVVEAPMTITNYDAEKALISRDVADELLGRLEGTGVVGLGLVLGPLRRPFAAEAPLLAPEDFDGGRFRVFNSPTQSDSIRALGGEPVNLSFEWVDQIEAGELRGAEFDVAQYWSRGMSTEEEKDHLQCGALAQSCGPLSDQKTWDGMSEEQQGWVRRGRRPGVPGFGRRRV